MAINMEKIREEARQGNLKEKRIARQSICTAIEERLYRMDTHGKKSSPTIPNRKASKGKERSQILPWKPWKTKHLKAAGIPLEHIPQTKDILKRENESPSPYLPWREDEVPRKLASWFRRCHLGHMPMKDDQIEDQCWKDIFFWLFSIDIEDIGYKRIEEAQMQRLEEEIRRLRI